MTSADDVANIIIGSGGTAVTVSTTKVEKTYVKVLTKITPATATGNKEDGPKDTKIVDLLRIEKRFSIDGFIDSADETNLGNYFEQGGVFNMTYDGVDYDINMDKLVITKSPKDGEQDTRTVKFTAVVGVDI